MANYQVPRVRQEILDVMKRDLIQRSREIPKDITDPVLRYGFGSDIIVNIVERNPELLEYALSISAQIKDRTQLAIDSGLDNPSVAFIEGFLHCYEAMIKQEECDNLEGDVSA